MVAESEKQSLQGLEEGLRYAGDAVDMAMVEGVQFKGVSSPGPTWIQVPTKTGRN